MWRATYHGDGRPQVLATIASAIPDAVVDAALSFSLWRMGVYDQSASSDAEDWVDDISAPLLLLHSEQDETVPVQHGRALYAAAGPAKEAWFAPTGLHAALINHVRHSSVVDSCNSGFDGGVGTRRVRPTCRGLLCQAPVADNRIPFLTATVPISYITQPPTTPHALVCREILRRVLS